jgi:hypothetical protein
MKRLKHPVWWTALGLLGVLALAPVVEAQISTEASVRARTLPLQEQVKKEKESAGFHLGPLALIPFVSLREFGYNSNVNGTQTNPVADWTAVIAAGTRFVLPAGSKVYFRGTAAPEYTWYLDSIARRSLGGSYNAQILGLFNRMTLEADGGQASTSTALSSESQQAVIQRVNRGAASLEVEILRRLSVFAGIKAAQTRNRDVDSVEGAQQNAASLDSTEYALNGGLRYKFSESFSFGMMVEGTRADYATAPITRNNESTGYLIVARYDRPRFYVALGGGYREGRGQGDLTTFPPYSTGTYDFFLSYFVTHALELQAYGSRRPAPSIDVLNSYFLETRNGVGLGLALGKRVSLRGAVELGSNDYPRQTVVLSDGQLARRTDNFVTVRGQVGFLFYRSAVLTLNASNERVTSNLQGAERSVFRFWTGLSFGGEWMR